MSFSASFLERYEILRPLGAGGMGEVFLARERTLDRHVAIKTVLSTHFVSGDAKQRFLREARITGGLSHPNIVKVLDQGEDEGRLFIIFDYVEGGDLGALLRERGPLAPALFFALVVPVVDAVSHAHAAGILHRDIKSDNVLLDASQYPRLADFGLAKGEDDGGLRTATGLLMGTPRYMAPELGMGERATPGSDQYALGVLMFEMLAGLPPFDAPQAMAVLRMHIDAPVPPLVNYRPDVPVALESLVLRVLSKQPAARFPSVAALHEALRAIEDSAAAWTPRARVVASGDVSGSSARVRRGTGRTAVHSFAPPGTLAPGALPQSTLGPEAAPPVPAAPPPPQRRTFKTAAVPPPSSRPGWVWPVALVALAAGAFALRGREGDPRYDALRFRLDRYRAHAELHWTDRLPLAKIQVSSPAASARSDTTTTFLRLPLADLAAVRLDVKLTPPGGSERALPLEFPAPTLDGLADALADLRCLPDRPALDEARITRRFNHTFQVDGKFMRFDARYRRDAATREKARKESGLADAMARRSAAALRPLLEQAAVLLDAPGSWQHKARVYDQAHHLANLEAFCQSNGISGSTEALRFLYALPPGQFPLLSKPVLPGEADYSRRLWRSDLVTGPTAAQVGVALASAPTPNVRRVLFELCAAKLPTPEDPVAVLGKPDHVMAKEWHQQSGHGPLTSYVRRAVPLDASLFAPAVGAHTAVAELVVEAKLAERTHLDLKRGNELVLCLRIPPGFAATPDNLTTVLLGARCDSAALLKARPPTMLELHAAHGDGAIQDSWDNRTGFVAKLDRILVRLTDQ